MSNPDNAVTQKTNKEDLSFADQVTKTLSEVKTDEKGSLVFPEDTSEELKYAVTAEKRQRDTRAAYTKASQEKKALEAENSALVKEAVAKVEISLTEAQKEELENLKFEDPDAWRQKLNVYENEARRKFQDELLESSKKVSATSLEEEEITRRQGVLEEFLKSHEGFNLNDDIIQNDIPPRITKKLNNGDISFEDFLDQCYEYVNTGKVVKQDELTKSPDLGKTGGTSKPDPNAVSKDDEQKYEDTVF